MTADNLATNTFGRDTVYQGGRSPDGSPVVTADAKPLSAIPSQRAMNHSPDGFEWGYGGSGPAQLALGLLIHATRGNVHCALDLYQRFKWARVARWPRSGWVVTRSQILAWVASVVMPGDPASPAAEGGAL